METIRMYLDNMFSALPRTAQMTEIKSRFFRYYTGKPAAYFLLVGFHSSASMA